MTGGVRAGTGSGWETAGDLAIALGADLGLSSPASTVLRVAATSCRPSRRTSFPSLGGTKAALVVSLPPRPSAADAGLELVTRCLRPGITVETTGSPTFLGNPRVPMPVLFDPGRTDRTRPLAVRRRGPCLSHHKGSSTRGHFGAQSHDFSTRCLRFAGRVTPPPRKTRFRLLAKLYRTGLATRRVPTKGFEVYPTSHPPFPSFRGARFSEA